MKSASMYGWPGSKTGQKAGLRRSHCYMSSTCMCLTSNGHHNTHGLIKTGRQQRHVHAPCLCMDVCKHTTHSAAHPAFKVALEKQEAWRVRPGLDWDGGGGDRGCICISCTVGEWWICGGGVRPWHYVLQLVYKWTLKDMCRPLSTFQITATLQGTDEGRALGLPNPGSSLFHVLQLPTMLSWISRWRLSANLKPVCNTKRIKPGWQ